MGEIALPHPTCNIHIVGVKSNKTDDLCMTPQLIIVFSTRFYFKIIMDEFGMSSYLI